MPSGLWRLFLCLLALFVMVCGCLADEVIGARKPLRPGKPVQQILIADGHLLFRSGLRCLLSGESDLEVVGEASTVSEANSKVAAGPPDVVVIDAFLLSQATESELDEIRGWSSQTAVLFLTKADCAESRELILKVGNPPLLSKNTAPAQLIRAVRQASRRDEEAQDGLSKTGADLKALAESSLGQARGPMLTLREQEVLKLLAEGRTVRETAAELALSAKTIEAHKLNVMRKLDIHSRSSLIQYAVSKGIIEAAVA